ncbi:MAG: flagellin FliC [Nitrospira sp.]|nr:flagellin FliC [Nitrospira sp.]
MAIIVNNNAASLAAQLNLSRNTDQLQRSVEHLSSGLRITRAADDAAGLGISSKLNAQIVSINQATRNANDGISLTQIADGVAGTINNLLTRMRELASQSASGVLGNTERSFVDQEFTALRSEIDRIASVTQFNGQALLSGSSLTFSVQIGYQSSSNDTLSLSLASLTTSSLGIASVNVSSSANAQSALSNLDSAISSVASARATYGATQNRFNATIDSLQVTSQNFTAAVSRIQDADIAYETSQFTKNQVLVQSGIAVLAQANALPQQALALLRG